MVPSEFRIFLSRSERISVRLACLFGCPTMTVFMFRLSFVDHKISKLSKLGRNWKQMLHFFSVSNLPYKTPSSTRITSFIKPKTLYSFQATNLMHTSFIL